MTVTWVVEREVFSTACFDQMIAHMRANGIPHHTVRIIPFVHEVEGKTPSIEGPVVVYGSIGVQKLAARQGWRPGVFTDDATFNYEAYRDRLGGLLLNDDAVRMPLSAVEGWLTENGWPDERNFFIKPNGDTKEFAGTTMTVGEFSAWVENMKRTGYLDSDDFDVVVAEPKTLGVEWRVVVVDGQIVGSSIYRQWGRVMPEAHILPEVAELVMEAHRRFVPAPVYVVDVAQVMGEGAEEPALKVIEYNTMNSAGLYACAVEPIIDAINAYVERTSGEAVAERI